MHWVRIRLDSIQCNSIFLSVKIPSALHIAFTNLQPFTNLNDFCNFSCISNLNCWMYYDYHWSYPNFFFLFNRWFSIVVKIISSDSLSSIQWLTYYIYVCILYDVHRTYSEFEMAGNGGWVDRWCICFLLVRTDKLLIHNRSRVYDFWICFLLTLCSRLTIQNVRIEKWKWDPFRADIVNLIHDPNMIKNSIQNRITLQKSF